ncbi:MAG: bifunctional adenosylcobinamide kinase/adenosylcobinamide-phosphate guanylyltransferase, partial [Verrucomicrobiota bacterium]
EVLEAPPCPLILVTNEVGTGIVPMNKLARQFRDRAGAVNRAIAEQADTVIVCICGIPMTLKS